MAVVVIVGMLDLVQASSSSSGQSSGHSSTGSARSACPTCGRVHQGQCYLAPFTCFRYGQAGHMARACPYSAYQQQIPQQTIASAAPAQYQLPPPQYPSTSQIVTPQGRGRGGRGFMRGFGQASTSQQGGRGQARVFTLTQ